MGYNECFDIGLAVALLLIHDELENYNKKKLGELIIQADEKISKKILNNLLEKYEKNKVMS